MKLKALIIGITAGLLSAGVLAAGTEAAQTAIEGGETAFTDTLRAIVNFLPFPWNVVGSAAVTVGVALFAWRRSRKNKG